MQLEARASEASEAKAAVDAATRRLHDERAAFERQQAVAAAEARALPVVTAVAVTHAATRSMWCETHTTSRNAFSTAASAAPE